MPKPGESKNAREFRRALIRIVKRLRFWTSADVRVADVQARSDKQAIQVFDANFALKAFAGTREYRLLPLFSGHVEYWLGFEVTILEDFEEVTAQAASMIVFRGPYATEKVPVLRAEWDCRPEGGHAQPHWHVYPWAPVAFRTTDVRTFESAAAAIRVDGPEGFEDLLHFHFAMSARWHVEPFEHQLNLQAIEALGTWFSNCILYVEGQLQYLESKAS